MDSRLFGGVSLLLPRPRDAIASKCAPYITGPIGPSPLATPPPSIATTFVLVPSCRPDIVKPFCSSTVGMDYLAYPKMPRERGIFLPFASLHVVIGQKSSCLSDGKGYEKDREIER